MFTLAAHERHPARGGRDGGSSAGETVGLMLDEQESAGGPRRDRRGRATRTSDAAGQDYVSGIPSLGTAHNDAYQTTASTVISAISRPSKTARKCRVPSHRRSVSMSPPRRSAFI